MKKFIKSLIILFASFSMLVFINTYTINDMRTDASHVMVDKAIDQGIDRLVAEINAIIPLQQETSVVALKTKIKQDKKVNELVDKYSLIVLHDLSREDVDTSINQDVHDVLKEYNKEIVGLTGDLINPVYSELIIEQVIKRIDFDDLYRQGLETVKAKTSPQKLNVIKVTDFFFNNLDTIRLWSGISTVIFVIILSFLTIPEKSFYASIAYLSGLSFVLNVLIAYGIQIMVKTVDTDLGSLIIINKWHPMTLALAGITILAIIMNKVVKKTQ